MSIGTLYTTDAQAQGKVIKSVAAIGGLKYDTPEGYVHFETNKTAEFLSKFASGKIPAWESKEGFTLFEGAVIARYLAGKVPNSGLLGHTPEDAALVDQWVHFAESEVDVATSLSWALVNGKIAYSKAIHTAYVERQAASFAILDKFLSTRTFLIGERITLADLWVAGSTRRALTVTLDKAAIAKIPHVIRLYETVINQPTIKEFWDPVPYLDKAPQYTPPKKEKEAKPAAAPTPKAEKKPKKKDDDDDDDDLVPAEPKAKNPLDELPKSTFDLEQWKREYSNKETRGPGGALEWLHANFDKEGFSIWRVEFKYNEELTQTFMSSNQIGGFFNRLEASRKYLFASVGVLGAANDSIIAGIMIMRGQQIEGVVDAAPDWESYAYTKLDLSDEASKAYFEAACAWDLEINGKKWVDGKNFK